ncbi:MAG: InlB B-repeat-containing protein, partial [Clostridiaceae bacterium]
MKGSRFTKFICLLLSVMMVLMLLPGSTLADVTNETSSDESEQVAVTDGDAEETEEAEEPEQDEAALEALEEEESEEPVILYTVNFYVEKDLFETQLIEAGGTASPATPSTPNKEEYAGMEFLYWYVSNEDVKFYLDTPITDHLDLHAHFGVAETEEPVAKSAALGTILPEGTFLKTYIFMVNGSQWGDTQIVATGDTLHEPATPTAAAGMRFVGWFDSGNNQFTSFGTQTVEETTTVTLHAVFVTAYYAFFYNAAGTAILETREPDAFNQVSTTNVTALQVAVDEAVTGWSYTLGGSAVGDTITVSGGNVNLYPIIEKVKWVSFNSNGGTYVSPMHVAPNTTLTAAMVATYVDSQVTGTVITRAGYTFSAWSGFTFGTIVTSDITLNANWTANTNTPYTLVYWTQNADDAEYSFEKTVAKTGTSGAVISPTTAELAATNLNSNYSAYFNNGTTAGGQTINGDGSSIVNIYHTRKTYTLTFKNTSNTTIYTQTYKYDQDVTAVWDVTAIKTLSNQGYVWESSITQAYYTFLQKMPGSNLTMTATHWQGSTYTWYYYLETLDGTAATAPAGSTTTTNGGITYYLYRTSIIVGTGISLTYAEDYFPITGFYQRDNTVPSFERTGNKYYASLFYRRSSYNLAFINGDTTNTISSIKYEASIEGQYYEPTKPTGVPTNFVFTGWYKTEGGYAGSEFTWTGTTMPAKNLVLYAVWKAPTFTGIAHLTVYGTGGGTYDLGTIPYGGTISSSALNAARAEAELYKPNTTDTFGGWLIDRGGSRTLFNANMQIYEDVVLYPQWISGVSYHVTYNLSGATGNLPADLSSYGVGAKAVVLDIDSTVVAPTGKVFTGWRVGTTGPVYYPGSAVTISGNTTLYAVWSDTASLVSITYDGNGNNSPAASSTHTVPVVNNTIHYVLGGDLFTYSGKQFVEWNTSADGSGTGYVPNDPALISASQPSSPTTLYAIWRTATYSVNASVTPSGTGSITGGTGTFDFGTDTTVTWTVAAGYAVSSVTDNTVPVSVTGNFYTLNDLSSSHTIVVTLAKTSFNLTYNGNGGTSGGSGSHSSTLTIGDPYIVEANTFTNAGHYFVGWSTTSGGPAESAYAPGTNHDMPAADVTLYAIWADKMDLVLTANSVALNYNEEAQSVTGFTGNISGLTYGGTTTAGASGTNPGQYTATFTGQTNLVILQSGTDVTDRY